MSENTANLSEYLSEAFGSNATYVEGLLERYKTDPNLVDESWQTYFSEFLAGGAPSTNGQAAAPAQDAPIRPDDGGDQLDLLMEP